VDIVISSDSEEAVEPSPVKAAAAQPSEPSAPVPNKRRRAIFIDYDGEEVVHGDGGRPVKRVRNYRLSIHTTERPSPFPAQLPNVAVTPGVAGPSGTVSAPITGPSSKPPKNPEGDVSDYEVSDIELDPDLFAALCKGL
jgi:hypothetical protein